MESKSPILEVKNLTKVFKNKESFVAVNNISFDLRQGEVLGLLGANGAGKTTTIQMLLSTLKPTDGSILYFGKNLSSHRSDILRQVAFASTYISLPWNMTVEQNLNVFGRLYGLTDSQIKQRRNTLLERFGIESKLKSKVSSLSAGQITRLVLVKAFMMKPKIALLDEPTASLDPDIAKDIIHFVLEQQNKEGVSILFTSHNMTEVAEVCDRILFMQNGSIIADDTPESLAKSASTSTVELVFNEGMDHAIGIVTHLGLSFYVDHRTLILELDEFHVATVLTNFAKSGVLYSGIKIHEPTLEDYFLKMVKQNKTRNAL
ncbi:MAG: ABC transporter ATP-binding protein [Chlamydiae bacterium]|nr:ABC transporter ATP-binding protein [Chlamydiota bacterium]